MTIDLYDDSNSRLMTFDFEKPSVETFAGLKDVAKHFWLAMDMAISSPGSNGIVELAYEHEVFVTIYTKTRKIEHAFDDPDSFMILWGLEMLGRA